uniref:ERCC4 domain-containing protein n=1 Tax=Trichuris muris TaxID=70415 RepID=A0A5S6PZD3_TRIMR
MRQLHRIADPRWISAMCVPYDAPSKTYIYGGIASARRSSRLPFLRVWFYCCAAMLNNDDDIIDLTNCNSSFEASMVGISVDAFVDYSASARELWWEQRPASSDEIPLPTDGESPASLNMKPISDEANSFSGNSEVVATVDLTDEAATRKKCVRRRERASKHSKVPTCASDDLKSNKKAKRACSKQDEAKIPTAERILSLSTILIDPTLSYAQKLEEEIDRNLTASMKKCRSEEYPNYVEARPMVWKNVIGFCRPKTELVLSALNREMDEEVLWIMDAPEFIKLVYNTVNTSPMEFPDVGGSSLPSRTTELENQFRPRKVRITALILNLSDYFNDLRKYEAAIVRSRMVNKDTSLTKSRFPVLSACKVIVSEYEVTQALVRLQMEKSVCCYPVDGLEEVASHAIGTFRAIAEREYKTHRMDVHKFPFLPEGEVAKGVRVDSATGSGYMKVWKQVLQQCFGRSSPEGAEAIAKKYGCPRALLDAYDRLSLQAEKESLLANLVVETKNGFNRRLGETYSKKVFLALTSKDPDLVLS